MADVPLTEALIVIAQNYAGDIVRQINRTAVLLKILAPSMRDMEGRNAAWVPEGDGAVAESFAAGADPANFGSDSQTAASIPHARYWAPFHVNGDALAAAASSRTPQGNINLWVRQMKNGAEKLAKLLDTDMYTGAGGNDLVGLDAAIGSVTNTYATIIRTDATKAFWLPNLFNAAGPDTSLTFKQIRDDMAAIKIASGYNPDFAMVSPATLNIIAGLFDPLKQYVFQTNTMVTASGDAVVLDGGVNSVQFDGCYFIADPWCPDGAIYYCNSGFMHMEALDAANSVVVLGAANAVPIGGLSDGFDTIPLGAIVELLAKSGDSQKAFLKCYPQLVVERPNAFGKRFHVIA